MDAIILPYTIHMDGDKQKVLRVAHCGNTTFRRHKMSIRPLNLPGDLTMIGELGNNVFQYPENKEWSIQEDKKQVIIEMMKNLKRLWPAIALISIISPALRDILLRGFMWEENGKPVGLILFQRRGTTKTWVISTLGVLPEYRRRGIAKKLFTAGIQSIRELGGEIVFLDVIAGNLPAYQLYEKMGFEHYTGSVELFREPGDEIAKKFTSNGYAIKPLDFFDWRVRYDLEKAITPERIRKFEPIEEGRFRQPALMRVLLPIINFAQGVRANLYSLQRSKNGDVIGRAWADLRIRSGGEHSIRAHLNPTYSDAAPYFLDHVVATAKSTGAEKRITLSIPQWQAAILEAAYAAGFKKRFEFHRMGLLFGGRSKSKDV